VRLRSSLFPLLALLLVSGCERADPARALLDDYRTRMGRVLDVDPGPLASPELSPWPRTRDRTLAIPAKRINLIEFLRLHRCDLGALVGARSSPLGRVMEPSRRLRYEIRFLRRADACLQRLEAQPDAVEEAARLATIVATKRAGLGPVIWNATLGDESLAASHALSTPPLAPATARGAGREAIGALQRLAVLAESAGGEPVVLEDWEAPWRTLHRSRFPAAARRSVALMRATLDQVAEAMETRQSQRAICPLGRPTPDARILENLFQRYYAGVTAGDAPAVQPFLADLSSDYRRWLDALVRLKQVQRVQAPRGFSAVADLQAEWQALVRARDRHTRLWQDLLEGCGLAPQAPGAH
jgi:hypothetical protein